MHQQHMEIIGFPRSDSSQVTGHSNSNSIGNTSISNCSNYSRSCSISSNKSSTRNKNYSFVDLNQYLVW